MGAMVTIPEEYYRELIQKETTLEIVKRFMEADQYATAKDIKVLLGVEEGEKA